jgi:hypothetical protein
MVIYKRHSNRIEKAKAFILYLSPVRGGLCRQILPMALFCLGVHDRPFLFTKINTMHIEEKYILKFQKIYEEEFGENISYDEALKQCTALVNLCKIVYRPITKEDIEKYGN